jgi:hypothetical protein
VATALRGPARVSQDAPSRDPHRPRSARHVCLESERNKRVLSMEALIRELEPFATELSFRNLLTMPAKPACFVQARTHARRGCGCGARTHSSRQHTKASSCSSDASWAHSHNRSCQRQQTAPSRATTGASTDRVFGARDAECDPQL